MQKPGFRLLPLLLLSATLLTLLGLSALYLLAPQSLAGYGW